MPSPRRASKREIGPRERYRAGLRADIRRVAEEDARRNPRRHTPATIADLRLNIEDHPLGRDRAARFRFYDGLRRHGREQTVSVLVAILSQILLRGSYKRLAERRPQAKPAHRPTDAWRRQMASHLFAALTPLHRSDRQTIKMLRQVLHAFMGIELSEQGVKKLVLRSLSF